MGWSSFDSTLVEYWSSRYVQYNSTTTRSWGQYRGPQDPGSFRAFTTFREHSSFTAYLIRSRKTWIPATITVTSFQPVAYEIPHRAHLLFGMTGAIYSLHVHFSLQCTTESSASKYFSWIGCIKSSCNSMPNASDQPERAFFLARHHASLRSKTAR
jgi:hypothetical protein